MKTTTRIILAALTSVALVSPTLTLAGSAQASSAAASVQTRQTAQPTLKISANKGFIHYGLTTDVVTVRVQGIRTGKVKFTIDGVAAGTVKLKKRKAKLTIPASLTVGTHVVKAKLKTLKKKIKIISYDTTMTLSTTAVTVNRATYDAPSISGQVIYKGAAADHGWVDTYNDDGSLTIGSDSPDLLGVHSVKADGTVTIYTHDYLSFPPGTYTMKAFFEYDAGFDEYLFGSPITVTVI